jgi:hypothetical protein
MDELIKISNFLDGYRLRQVEIIDSEDSESRYTAFFKLLKEGDIKSDDDAVKRFYGEKATIKHQGYRKFKSDFRNRLINSLFFIDVNHSRFTDLETATMTIQKEWAAINILFAKGDNMSLAIQMAEHLLPTAKKYELTEIVIYITDRLKDAYGGQIGNQKKYNYYKWLQKEHMDIWQAEIKAKDLYQEIRMESIKSNAYKPQMAEVAKKGLKELEPALKKHKTIRLILYAYVVKIAQFTSIHDYKTASLITDEAIEVLKNKPFNAQRPINSFLNQKLVCHVRLKEFEKGDALVKEILELQIEGTLSWFKTLEHAATLAFHTKNYQTAYDLYTKARENPQFKTLTLRHLEIWHLYKAYLYFLMCIGKVDKTALKSGEFAEFKLNKFLNDVNLFENDKEGMKISVLIIEVALNLAENKFGKMIDAVEALTRFRQRHVSKSHALYRHNLMIKMIAQIPRSGFMKDELKRLTEAPFRSMKKVPIQSDGQSFQLEIIPLEDMWDFIVDTLR